MEDYLKFCYYPMIPWDPNSTFSTSQSNISFTVWHNGDFGLCFEYLVFYAFIGALFGVTSAFYAGIKYSKIQRKKKSAVLIIRGLISFCTLAAFLVDFVGSFWLARGQPYSVMLSLVIQLLAWSMHLFYIWVTSRSISHYGRGPLNLNIIWLLTLLGSIFLLRTTIQWRTHKELYQRNSLPLATAYFSTLSEIVVYVVFSFQCLYGLTLFFKVSHATGSDVKLYRTHCTKVNQGSFQWSDDVESSVRQHLISSEWKTDHAPSSYGSINSGLMNNLNFRKFEASEDNANVLSRLSFWWVGPLMRRGTLGLLQKPEDLLQLPKSLKTAKLREKFQKVRTISTPHVLDNTQDYIKKEGAVSSKNIERANIGINSEVIAKSQDGEELDDSETRWLQIKSQKGTGSSCGSKFSLFGSLNRAFGIQYYPLGALKLLADMLGFAGPLLLHALVSFMENRNEPMSHGYYYALGLFLSTLFGSLLNTHFTYQVNKVGLKIRAALVTEIYRKALSVSSTTLSCFSTGQVVNFMSTDSDRIVNFCGSFHQFWSLPFQVIVSLALLYQQVGLAFLAGLAFCILLIPVNRWLAVKIGKLSTEMMAQKDQRVKLMSEILAGIRVIKFYAWENNFIKKIFGIRVAELKSLKGRKYLDALCVYFWATTPVLISILTFTTYVLIMRCTLTAAKVFTSLALFNMLISPLNAFPWVINGLVEAWVSTKRVNAFLQLRELDLNEYYSQKEALCDSNDQSNSEQYHSDGDSGSEENQQSYAVHIKRGSFTWAKESDEDTGSHVAQHSQSGEIAIEDQESASEVVYHLTDINLRIQPGQFVGVMGKVGSGKSSLLSAITAEMRKAFGKVKVADLRKGFGLSAQEAWIQHATVQDNILFGQPLDTVKYKTVLFATALEPDIKILPAGDKTEVGENGVTLSGGQKARIALARAIYQDKDVYLLDDPLAAVDVHVAAHLYQHCIQGLLKHKTRVLCTHHIKFLREADCVIHMEDGLIHNYGTPEQILPSVEDKNMEGSSGQGVVNSKDKKDLEISQASSKESDSVSDHAMQSLQYVPEAVLVKEEEKEEGVVSFSVYFAYWSAVGHVLAPLVLLALLLMQASRNISDWWLAYWITNTNSNPSSNVSAYNSSPPGSDDLKFYLGIYGGLAAANSVLTLFRAFLYAYGGICAAMILHKKLLNSILLAPTSFFDTTPIGRIVNRFSSDIYAIDDSLPFIMNILLAQVFGLFGTLAVTCYGLPWFLILLLPLALFYYNIQKYYRRTSRELKRLSTVTLSPIYAHFSETLTGLCTIRALRASDRFMQDNEAKLEVNQRANYGSYAVSQWLGIRLQMLGVAMVAGVAFIAVLEHHFNTVNPGLVGLAISYALSVTNLLSGVVTSFTETEKEMVSVERAMQYIKGAPKERRDGDIQPLPEWPSQGILEFKDVVLTYREGLPSALKGVSFITQPGEKIGVVGRTGAGKSSLFKALFRMVELSIGSISIDGINITSVPLERLRSCMAVIPQDPFLFSGSLRENLDPCNKYNDAELFSVLGQCHLKEAVQKLGGLECEVEEKGRVFSVGQRQLVCLARALLTHARLICIDEATASVDQQTDSMIQETIRSEFTSSTVITIAHRIETILSSDRILVMEQGHVKEFASPRELLDDRDSFFSSLLREHNSKMKSTHK